jgi:hypothetical protein
VSRPAAVAEVDGDDGIDRLAVDGVILAHADPAAAALIDQAVGETPLPPARGRLGRQAMRDAAGSAAAPAARCRNRLRWGSFILNLPSHYSITSSARASSVGGTSRPSALAVCRLVGNWTGRSAGFAPFRI